MHQGRTGQILKTLTAAAVLGTCKVACAASGATMVFNYPNGFAGQTGVSVTGASEFSGAVIELTGPTYGDHQAGAAWYTTQQNIQAFTSDFTFQLNPSAYGFTFGVQNTSASTNPTGNYAMHATGDSNCMGYGAYTPPINPAGIAVANSIAIGFDLTGQGQNVAKSPNLPNTATLYINGGPYNPMIPENDLNPYGINLHSGHVMAAHVVYDGTLLTMVLKDTSTGAQARLSWPLNIPAAAKSNTAWVGFTGGTIPNVTQNILSWDFYEGYASRLATPTFSVAPGSYTSAQNLTISGPPGATIYYSTNGQQPTTSSSKYTGPITVGSNEIVQAVAVESGFTDSLVATGNYQIQASGAPLINFANGFSGASGLVTLAGWAQMSGSSIQLTDTTAAGREAGAAWYSVPVNVQTFTTNFTLKFADASGDGMTFAIQNQNPPSSDATPLSLVSGGPNAFGANGVNQNGLGYEGILESVAVKFDLHGNTTGLYKNGAEPNGTGAVAITGISLNSGDPIAVTLTYNGSTLSMAMKDTSTGKTFSTSWSVGIPSIVGGNTAYIGFTGSTGYFYANQYIQSWTYAASQAAAAAVPSPPTNLKVQ